MDNVKFKVQLVVNDANWPFVGNAYANRNGAISIYLDDKVVLHGGQKLYLSATKPRTVEATASAQESK